MKLVKNIIKKLSIVLILGIIIFACYGIYYYNSNIVVKYKRYMDSFFGSTEWKVTDRNINSTNIRVSESYDDGLSYDYYKKYISWEIEVTDFLGETNTFTISNYRKIIRNHYFGIFSKNSCFRYSDKEILAEQLYEIACKKNETYIKRELLSTILSKKELEYLIVKFRYDSYIESKNWLKFLKEDWFNYNDVSAENLTNNEILECYLDIYTMPSLDNLDEEFQIQLEEKTDDIIQLLQSTYENNIKYDVVIGIEQRSNL